MPCTLLEFWSFSVNGGIVVTLTLGIDSECQASIELLQSPIIFTRLKGERKDIVHFNCYCSRPLWS